MVISFDQIVTKFPHKAFSVIYSKPDYQIIHDMWTLFYDKASTITNMINGGNNGHIGIVMRDSLYAKISPTPYNVPIDPWGTITVTLQSNKAQQLKLLYKKTEAYRIHDNHQDVSLKTMVLKVVNNTYIFPVHDVFTRYIVLWTQDIMNHLVYQCGLITAADIEMKKIYL